ncbi:MAG: PspC domain-containing protein [Rhodoglobus sp.]
MTTVPLRPPLVRSRDAVLGGVCAGIAVHLGWNLRRTRITAAILGLCGGAGVLLYLWLWALVPLEAPEADDAAAVRRVVPVAALLVGISAVAALVVVGTVATGSSDAFSTPALLLVTASSGIAVAWSLTFDRHDRTRSPHYQFVIRALAAALLLLAGIAALLSRPSAIDAVLGVGMVVLGVGVMVAPRVVTLWSDLQASRTAQVREVQRAEIAAHLHDSVLQTLALIQNRAGASSEVARIARAQERELRDWLFAGDEPPAADLATELRGIAAAIELDYPVRIEVVAAGESASPNAIVAAAREAMLNAARHAGGEVSVYLETSADGIDVYVRDRGAGVDLAKLPADRLGIRESIIGRMTRAGGTATVKPGAGGRGTEVHLHLEVPND